MKNQLHLLWESLLNGDSPYFKLRNYTLSNIYYWIKSRFVILSKKRVEQMIDRAIECKLCWENGSCLACGCDTFDVLKSGKPCNIPDDIERRFNEYETLMRQKYWKCIHEQPYDLHYCMEEHEKEEFDKLLYLVSKKYPNE